MSRSSSLGPVLGADQLGLERHAADRAVAGADLLDLGMHRAGVDRIVRSGRAGSRPIAEIVFRRGLEFSRAAGRAEHIGLAGMLAPLPARSPGRRSCRTPGPWPARRRPLHARAAVARGAAPCPSPSGMWCLGDGHSSHGKVKARPTKSRRSRRRLFALRALVQSASSSRMPGQLASALVMLPGTSCDHCFCTSRE